MSSSSACRGVATVAIAALLALTGCGSSDSEEQSSTGSTETTMENAEPSSTTSTTTAPADTEAPTDTEDEPADTDIPNLALGGRTLQEGTYSLELNGTDLVLDVDDSAEGLQLDGLNPNSLSVTGEESYFAIGSVLGLVPAELSAAEMSGPPPADQLVEPGTAEDVAAHLAGVPGLAVVGDGERTLAGESLHWWDIDVNIDGPDGSTVACPGFIPRGSECVLVVAAEDWGGFATDTDRLRLFWSPSLEVGGIAETSQDHFDDWVTTVDALLDGMSAAQA